MVFYNAANQVVRTVIEQNITAAGATTWEEVAIGAEVPTGATRIEAYLRHESGEPVRFDDLKIEVFNAPTAVVVQENSYYPFGMNMRGLDYVMTPSKEDKFTFQGKEKQTDFGLNWYDFHARNYDPQIVRTPMLDPHAEKYPFLSPYSFLGNNPLFYTDPTGMDVIETTWGTSYTGADAQNMFRQLQQQGSNRDLPKPEVSTQTRMYQTFKYNDNCRDCGVDMVTHQTTTTTIQRDDRGTELYRMAEVNTTTVTIDAKGEISNNLTQSKITRIITNSEKGLQTSNYVESAKNIFVSDKSAIGSISKDLENMATSVANFKQKHGISPIQQIARDNTEKSTISGYVSTGLTVVGIGVGIVSLFLPEPFSKPATYTGIGLGVAGFSADMHSRSQGTNPERIILKIKQ